MRKGYEINNHINDNSNIFYIMNYKGMNDIDLYGEKNRADKYYKLIGCCIGVWKPKKLE